MRVSAVQPQPSPHASRLTPCFIDFSRSLGAAGLNSSVVSLVVVHVLAASDLCITFGRTSLENHEL